VDEIQRRALRNGAIAAVVTAILGFSIDALVSGPPEPVRTTPSHTPSPTPTCGPAWASVPSRDPDPAGNQLLGVAAISESVAWAVGASGPADAPTDTLVERWNGQDWTVVPSPNGGTVTNELNAVSGTAPNDVWAVGASSSGGWSQPLILHWDGATWTLVTAPSLPAPGVLSGVAAVAPDDVWAVGSVGDPALGLERPLALHFDGTSWSVVPVPSVGGTSSLRAVSARRAGDVWAVGALGDGPLVLHLGGRGWRRVAADAKGVLVAVEALARDDVWAAGSALIRWNGATWAQAGFVRRGGEIHGIAATGASGVWAVGSSGLGEAGRALVQRFDGLQWSLVSGGGIAGAETLTAAAVLPGGAVWAVGFHDTAKGQSTLVVRNTIACA